MKEIILNFPRQFEIGAALAKKIKLKGKFRGLCLCGIGGSALAGNILKAWLKEIKINLPISIQRDYSLSSLVKKDWLLIVNSYSGNTEETISCFKEARKKGFKMIVMTSNGKLEKLAKKNNLALVKIPGGLPPRMTLGYQSAALVQILNNLKIIKIGLAELTALKNNLKPKESESEGKRIAKKLKGKIPLIYSSKRLKAAARIWKIKFNENSKVPAFWNYFPELNHNEMTGFANINHRLLGLGDKFYLLFLQDPADPPKIKKRMKLTKEILQKRGIKGEIIKLDQKPFLEQLFACLLLGDWVSVYLAKEYGIDPLPVKMVEEFKKMMKA